MRAGNARTMRGELNRNLDAGRPVVAGVDYRRGRSSGFSAADHFITITGRNADGSYTAVDPAGGHEITLRSDGNGMLRGGRNNRYRVSEMVFLNRAA